MIQRLRLVFHSNVVTSGFMFFSKVIVTGVPALNVRTPVFNNMHIPTAVVVSGSDFTPRCENVTELTTVPNLKIPFVLAFLPKILSALIVLRGCISFGFDATDEICP